MKSLNIRPKTLNLVQKRQGLLWKQ
jgi:hypothetical protein